ncbi:hypothetical protein OG585_52670 (plasmid) [Streptomyces sp. NBC_01340]|uniref:nSTAND1 domain-containing NTPase n=1 Tax=Streptomyces sp. NBC_01340 TaxID=2903830 RepID=UPI002E13E1BF|nr:hypothetical protein OG585_52670 [Streptomyces sp. NBC_01340]
MQQQRIRAGPGLADGPGDVATVLERLARARLITLDHDTVDLAHEALITAWPGYAAGSTPTANGCVRTVGSPRRRRPGTRWTVTLARSTVALGWTPQRRRSPPRVADAN